MRVIAVDWSGRRSGAARAIWLAEVRDGLVVRLEDGRTREEVADHLVALAADGEPLVVGLDFSFSLPEWFVRARGYASPFELWAAASIDAETWLTDLAPPFWGTRGHHRPDLPAHLRVTEASLRVGSTTPKSTFLVSGAGSVGAGSLRGFPVLHRLRRAGFAVWPFDDATPPALFEVWPRLLTGPVVKTRADDRTRYLDEHGYDLPNAVRDRAVGCDDAFDALVSAVVMDRHVDDLLARRATDDRRTRLEGAVWCPPSANAMGDVS